MSHMEHTSANSVTHAVRYRSLAQVTLLALLLMLGAATLASLTGVATPAYAANVSVSQCNDVGPSPQGATTLMTCTVTVVNTISGGRTSSTLTVSRECALGPCPPGNGIETSSSTDLITNVTQCNGSSNDAAHPIVCNVDITNNISADTPGANPVTAATVNQCVGSGGGGGGTVACDPFPASTTSATVTQCNGSANGGGGAVACTVGTASTVSPAIAVTVNQCNGTGNPGGSTVTCRTRIATNITAAVAATSPATASPSSTPTASSTAAPSATVTTSASAPVAPAASASSSPVPSLTVSASVSPTSVATDTPTAAAPEEDITSQVTQVPRGGVQTGGGSTDSRRLGLLALGIGLLLAAVLVTMYRRRMVDDVTRAGR